MAGAWTGDGRSVVSGITGPCSCSPWRTLTSATRCRGRCGFELAARLANQHAGASARRLCGGTLRSRHQYRIALDEWGYADGRVAPSGRMTSAQAALIDAEP
jgi:hypothetical protein